MATINALSRLHMEAERHAAERNWAAAIGCLETVVAMDPLAMDALLQLSYIESLAGRYRRARECALRAAELRPRRPADVAELIARLRTFNEATAIEECVRRLPPLSRMDIRLLLAVAAQLSHLNLQERALAFLDEARRGDPDYPPTLLARAQVLIYLGRFDKARVDLERCLRRAPQIPKLYWLLANLDAGQATGLADMISTQLQRPGLGAGDTALLGYALHMVLDRQADHAGAWSALEIACRAKRSTFAYRDEDSIALVSSLIDATRASLPATSALSDTTRVPVFIVGMHRSGTSLLEQLLDRHSQVRGIGELYDFTSAMRYATDHHCRGVIDKTLVERASHVDFNEVGNRYLQNLEWRLGAERFFTDKLPSNFLNIGFICQALPQAKILHMVRDPVETCFSNLRELFSDANPYSYDQCELADFHGQYRRLMAHWHERFPGRILDVDYRTLTLDPERVLRQVSAFCGFEFEPAMLEAGNRGRGVATASAVQVRQGIQAREVPKWKPYEQYLQPLIQRLRMSAD